MKLNFDCIRDILLCIEEHTGLRKMCSFIDTGLDDRMEQIGKILLPQDYQKELLNVYSNEEIIYHLNYCIEAKLISEFNQSTLYQIIICDLTPDGHSFLNDIRDNKIWSGVKKVSSEIGARSIDAITRISSNIVTQLIKSYFNL